MGVRTNTDTKKAVFYTELAYLMGLAALALGAAVMERANMGVSMVVAPAYIIFVKLSSVWSFFTFGMAEYTLQGILLIALALVMRRFKKYYLFSFVTAVIYGFMLDAFMLAVALVPWDTGLTHHIMYVLGLALCAVGVSLLFNTYVPPEAYELVVKELAAKYKKKIHRVKTAYDCVSCLAGVILSFAFFGFGTFVGVRAGTVLCALVNGWLIGRMGLLWARLFDFRDALPRLKTVLSEQDTAEARGA